MRTDRCLLIRYRWNYQRQETGGVMPYSPPDSVIVSRIQRAFASEELRERARATSLVERERNFDVVALFHTLSFGFAAGSDQSLQAFLERYVEMAECDELGSYVESCNGLRAKQSITP
jgi:hypothetical protein